MKILNVAQGSDQWHAARAGCLTASEAPAMMGDHKQIKRIELLHAKATGLDREVSWWVQKFLFDRGHECEAAARPIVEEIIGDDLFPATATDDEGRLLASFDGMTVLGDTLYEHKLWNEALAEQVRAGELDPHYVWQLEQQLLISGAERVIFVTSDGTRENFAHMEYRPVDGRVKQLLDGWRQFETDLAAYVPDPKLFEPAPSGRAPDQLPALRIEVTGMVTHSNLAEFKATALAAIHAVNRDLTCDEDFADADKAVKWCKDVEQRIDAAKQHALSQTASIDELFRTLDEISEEARRTRLDLDKLVKARKEQIKAEIIDRARASVAEHVRTINATLGAYAIGVPASLTADLAAAIKGLRTLSSITDAADTAAAHAKIAASQQAERTRANIAVIEQHVGDHMTLFADHVSLVATKQPDDLRNLIAARIAEEQRRHEAWEAAERERIRREEEARAQRLAQQQITEPPGDDARAAAEPTPAQVSRMAPPTQEAGAAPMPAGDMIKLGGINAILAPLAINSEGLASLGFHPVSFDRASKLYRASDVPAICRTLAQRLDAIAAQAERKQAA